MPPLLVDT